MDPRTKSFIEAHGMPMSDRCVFDNFIWDGSTLGTVGCAEYDADGEQMLACEKISSSLALHELGHWLIAEPWQRELPEYGMAFFPIFGGNRLPDQYQGWVQKLDWERQNAFWGGLMDKAEQEYQEHLADLLSCQFELELEIPDEDGWGEPGWKIYLDKCRSRWGSYSLEKIPDFLAELGRRGFNVSALKTKIQEECK